jgi:hypothetical protein
MLTSIHWHLTKESSQLIYRTQRIGCRLDTRERHTQKGHVAAGTTRSARWTRGVVVVVLKAFKRRERLIVTTDRWRQWGVGVSTWKGDMAE